MTNRHLTILAWAVATSLTVASSPALAQNGAGAALDRATKALHQKFVRADTDKDGFVTLAEAEKGGMPTTAKYFSEIDATHRGKVSEEEIRRFMVQRAADHAKTP